MNTSVIITLSIGIVLFAIILGFFAFKFRLIARIQVGEDSTRSMEGSDPILVSTTIVPS